MSKAALVEFLDRWLGSHDCDSDSSFLTRFLNRRDEDAFATLVHRHGPLVYGTCLRILGNRTDTDDAFQAVFFVLALVFVWRSFYGMRIRGATAVPAGERVPAHQLK